MSLKLLFAVSFSDLFITIPYALFRKSVSAYYVSLCICTYATAVLHHHMSLTCCRKSHQTSSTLAPISHTMHLLNGPAHSKATPGDRSFSLASSSVLNSIPNDVRCAPLLSSSMFRLKKLISFSLQRLYFIFDDCIYVHGLALS